MANTGNTYSDTKSTCDMLEVSPSAHQPSSSIYQAGSEPQAVKKESKKSATEGKESNLGVARKKASKAPGAF
jgi:hypothetical protein